MPIINTSKALRERPATDFYPTSYSTALGTLYHIVSSCKECRSYERRLPLRVLDPGAGDGVWGRAARQLWPGAYIVGVENDNQHSPDPAYDEWHQVDFRAYAINDDERFDLIVGNPPYRLAEAFIRHGIELLKPGGTGALFFLLRLEYLASKRRMVGLYSHHKPVRALVMSKRPSFTGNRKTNATDYMMLQFTNDDGRPKQGKATVLEHYNYDVAYNNYLTKTQSQASS